MTGRRAATTVFAARWIPSDKARYPWGMMRKLLTVLFLLPALVTAAEVYRWVDSDGEVHYSDRPIEGAEIVVIEEAQTFSSPAPAPTTSRSAANTDSRAAEDEKPAYSRFEIVSPQQEEVFWNTGGELSVALRLSPRLKSGHTVSVFLDGQQVKTLPRGSTRASLNDVVRGQHSIHAEIRDKSDATMARTDSVQFMVQQTSIQNPNRASGP